MGPVRRPAEEPESLGDLLLASARALRREYAAALAGLEPTVTPGQARALRVVIEHASPRLSVLAERLRIAPRSATEVVDALEALGLVQRQPDPTDRRAACVVPTEAGLRLGERAEATRQRAADRLLGVLPAGDREELTRLLRVLLAGQGRC